MEKIEEVKKSIEEFKLPRYEMLTHINLYLEQVIDEVVLILKPLFGDNSDKWITPTMVGNYVKQGLLPRPIGKKYTKEHIAYLIFISVAKQFLSIGEIKKLIKFQIECYPISISYDYFCKEFEFVLYKVFGLSEGSLESEDKGIEAKMCRTTIISVCCAIYTRKMLAML